MLFRVGVLKFIYNTLPGTGTGPSIGKPNQKRQRTDRTPGRFAQPRNDKLSARFWSAASPLPLLVAVLCLRLLANGQVNSWTNSGSGNWEDLRWSLGQPPGPG